MTMMELISLASILLSLFVITTLLYLRWKEPLRPRPYKVGSANCLELWLVASRSET